ncbi:MAG: carboxymuconolactone decarboxylase family protein [Pseudomonadota bacterium]|jgi:uncharacterized peroxidase-related enzyme|nr:carboxymuconolactone decarboxylase family protein [Pseudomonadota bacterium]
MPFFKSHPADANPGTIFSAYPEIYSHWARMGQELINGSSPLSTAEREMLQAYVAGVAKCNFALIAHAEVAYAMGIKEGLIDKLLSDLSSAPVDKKFKPLLAFAGKLMAMSSEMTQEDADEVFNAGWDEKALHDTIAITARMSFMCRINEGCGFTPYSRDKAKKRAQDRLNQGYINLYPSLAGDKN